MNAGLVQAGSVLQRSPVPAITLIWALVAVLLAALSPGLTQRSFPDVDDALRLVQVRDLLAGQGWYDLHQYRLTPPEGTLMHWSRLVDLPLAAAIGLLSLVMPVGDAEFLAAVAVPLLLLLGTMLFVGDLVWHRLGRLPAVLTLLAFVLVPVLPGQFQPMRIDHHAWQVLSVAAALWAIFRKDPQRGGAIAGLAMAAGLMISLETIVMAAGFAAVLTLRWLLDPAQRMWLVRYLQALATGLVILFALTRGLPDLAAHCDAISPPHLALFALVAIGASLLAAPAHLHPAVLIGGLGASALCGIAVIASTAPACLAPPFAGLDPVVQKYWYVLIAEGQPLWRQPPGEALPAALQCLLAVALAAWAALRGAAQHRVFWRDLAVVMAVAALAGFATQRSLAFAGLVAAIPLGWLAAQLIARWQATPRIGPKLGVAAVLFAAFLPGALVAPLLGAANVQDSSASAAPATTTQCALPANLRRLDALGSATIFTTLDFAPLVLAYSHHGVVASSHHRAERAMRDVIVAFTREPETARAIVAARGAQFVAICPSVGDAKLYRTVGGKRSLAAQLAAGTPPAWLERVDVGAAGGLMVWKVVPAR